MKTFARPRIETNPRRDAENLPRLAVRAALLMIILFAALQLASGCRASPEPLASEQSSVPSRPESRSSGRASSGWESPTGSLPAQLRQPAWVILGRPSSTDITARVISDDTISVWLEYGPAGSEPGKKTASQTVSPDAPADFILDGLQPGTKYQYRLNISKASGTEVLGPWSFTSARQGPADFSFVIQSDSHLLNKADKPLYARNMAAMAALNPDFFVDMGDTFLNDKDIATPSAVVRDIVREQVPYLSALARSAPLFLVIGNHEGEYGYLLTQDGRNLAAYSTLWRKTFYPNPVPSTFYSGNAIPDPHAGLPENYYAFTWGDVLFVALDPYRYTVKNPAQTGDSWDWTLGEAQYQWLKKTLETSRARFKLVFAHHALGNLRGGAAISGMFEWGGQDRRGENTFSRMRPGWDKPIHQLMQDNGVTIFFQGHDHIFAREQVGTVVYQTLPKPAEIIPDQQSNLSSYNGAAVQINSGFLQVHVVGDSLRVEYHRVAVAGQPANASVGVVHAYTVDRSGTIRTTTSTDDRAAFQAYGGRPAPGSVPGQSSGEAAPDQRSSRQPTDSRPPRPGRTPSTETRNPQAGSSSTSLQAPAQSGSLQARPMLSFVDATSVRLSVIFNETTRFQYRYGSNPSQLEHCSPVQESFAQGASFTRIENLEEGKKYSYQLVWFDAVGQAHTAEPASFVTRSPTGRTFSFLIEADPHLDENSDQAVYEKTLAAMAALQPDFIMDLGDTSMAEKLASDSATYHARNRLVRSYWDNIGHNTPFFMVMGNHDGEHGWPTHPGSPSSTEAAAIRRMYLPAIEKSSSLGFSMLTDTIYSMTWGDAQIIVLDPYLFTMKKPGDDPWEWTLGKEQYDWLETNLSMSKSKFRFVFIHHLTGGVTREGRGGAQAALIGEWGGRDRDGSMTFSQHRPGWSMPIHDLLERYQVDVVFHGHDHFFALEKLGKISYLLVPQPSSARSSDPARVTTEYGYAEGTFLAAPGFLQVVVDTHEAVVNYLQADKPQPRYSFRVAP